MSNDIYYTSADGLTLYARAYGNPDAPLTALCMHGLTRNHKDFEPMIAELGDRYRYISVDVRGRGQSDRADDPALYNPLQYAEDMIALLDHLGLQRVVLIGTSMGGLMSMLLMDKIPERVAGIVLNDIGPIPDQAGLKRISGYATNVPVFSDWDAAAKKFAETQSVAYQNFTDADWIDFAQRTCRQREDGMIVPDYDPKIMEAFSLASPSWKLRFGMWRLFGKLKSRPLLILRGEQSDILISSMANRMHKRHRDSRLVNIPQRGHAPMLDEPKAITALASFLGRIEDMSA
jgi:pimeloyl-ACP methyl ester carboxylesterase